jgi:hypothetical protein
MALAKSDKLSPWGLPLSTSHTSSALSIELSALVALDDESVFSTEWNDVSVY